MTQENTSKSHILLVEDTDDDAYYFERRVQKSGFDCKIHHVTDGAQAVDFIQKSAASKPEALPKIIFLDLKMPLLNGFEVLEWLQKQPFRPQMVVIVLSGSEHQHDRNRAAELGAAEYLVKPIKASDLDRLLPDVCPAKNETGAPV